MVLGYKPTLLNTTVIHASNQPRFLSHIKYLSLYSGDGTKEISGVIAEKVSSVSETPSEGQVFKTLVLSADLKSIEIELFKVSTVEVSPFIDMTQYYSL